MKTIDGNEAAASVAYRASEVIAIYPMHGSMNFLHCPNPAGLERANYMHMLRSWEVARA